MKPEYENIPMKVDHHPAELIVSSIQIDTPPDQVFSTITDAINGNSTIIP
jgi:hypothetical protein